MMPTSDKRNWADRKQSEFLERVREDPGKQERLEKSWFGRLMLRGAERASPAWEPLLRETEAVRLKTRAERVTWLNRITPGWLILTDKRLVFTPVLEVSFFPWVIKTGEMTLDRLAAKRGLFLSRGVYLKPFWLPSLLRGWIHIANLKVKCGREAWWVRVEDPQGWERAIVETTQGRV